MAQRFYYTTCCVEVPPRQVVNLHAMIERARPVEFATFARHCDWRPLAGSLDYQLGRGRGLRLKDDYHVRFYRSRWLNRPCYFLVHSAIDYIFTRQAERAAN